MRLGRLAAFGKWIVATAVLTKAKPLKGVSRTVALAFGGLLAFFYFYTSGFGVFSPESHVGFFFGATLALTFLWYPSGKRSPQERFSFPDVILAALALGLGIFFAHNYPQIANRVGQWTSMEIGCGLAAILLSLEAARRSVGLLLPMLAVCALLYTHESVSRSLPLIIAHKGFDIVRISSFMFTTMEGLFGTVAYTLATYVMPFVLFGAFLEKSGVGKFFIDATYALVGRTPSGTAQVAVMGSALMGSISGSPVANVVATGAFTIPLMKKAGYRAETAGAVESCASTGSMFTPPVMGAAAFFMVEFTGIPYIEIIKIAAIPAVIYYLSIATMVWLEARKGSLGKLGGREEVPRVLDVVRKGWFQVIPILLLLYLLMEGRSPSFSAFWSALACIACSWLTREFRMGGRAILGTFAGAGRNVVMIASITGVIGILVGVLNLSGLGLKLSQIILALSGGNLLLTVFLVCVAAFILGMGSPIAAVYVILAVIAPAAMVELGVPVMSAHLLLIWYSQLSGLTPPVCLVAFATASISGGDPFKTGILALKLGFSLVLLPILFVYTPLLLTGSAFENGTAILTSLIAVLASCLFIQRHFLRKNSWLEQAMFGVGGLLLYTTYVSWNIAGLVLVAVPVLVQLLGSRKAALAENAAQA